MHIPHKIQASGFSLVELLVAVALSIFLLAGVISVFSSSRNTFATQEGISFLQENARFAFSILENDISNAGYIGCSGNTNNSFANTLDQNHAIGSGYTVNNLITATDGGNGPDTLILRQAVADDTLQVTTVGNDPTAPLQLDATAPGYSDLGQFDVLSVSNCTRGAVFMITNQPGNDGIIQHATGIVAANNHDNAGLSNSTTDLQAIFGGNNEAAFITRMASNTYNIAQGQNGNALFRNGQELVEAVSDLQITYGIDLTCDGAVDRYVTAVPGNFNQVASIRVALTMDSGNRINPPVQKIFTNTYRVRNRCVL